MSAFFFLMSHADECAEKRKPSWLFIAAMVGGLSIWAVHFVAMLGFNGTINLSFDPIITFVSAVLVVLGFLLAVYARDIYTSGVPFLAGTVAALSVTLMHFVGMAGIQAPAGVTYEGRPILVAIAVSIVAMVISFQRFRANRGMRGIVEAAFFMIVGVCILHFTAMSATTIAPNFLIPPAPDNISNAWLVAAVVVVAFAITLMTTAAAILDRYLTDLKGFADATLEGLAIVRGSRIVEVNARFSALFGLTPDQIIGRPADEFLVAADLAPIAVPRSSVVEASPLVGDRRRSFEASIQSLEYLGRMCQVLAIMDMTEKKAAQRQIELLASYDPLTGLANRTLLQQRMDEAIVQLADARARVAVLALDLDRFKAVNDLFGHPEGDRVLKSVATILSQNVSPADTVARMGGDEFIILQIGVAQPEGARALGTKILDAFNATMNGDRTAVGVSIGVAVGPDDGTDPTSLLHAADLALYHAKAAGRGRLSFYATAMDEEVRDRRQFEADLRRAVTQEELYVVYQPLMSVDGRLLGYEALLRWLHRERGDVFPETFIPIAEETGVIVALGEWVLREACGAASKWEDHLTIAVNVSPRQFLQPDLVGQVADALRDSGLAPHRLGLEITETILVRDRDKAIEMLKRIKAMGVSVVMDDFGAGYSSLSCLQIFPFDKIKIDRSFINSMENDEGAEAIVRAIIGLARSMNLYVVAEGVETERQYRMIRDAGCSEVQGYYVGPPVHGSRFARQKGLASPMA